MIDCVQRSIIEIGVKIYPIVLVQLRFLGFLLREVICQNLFELFVGMHNFLFGVTRVLSVDFPLALLTCRLTFEGLLRDQILSTRYLQDLLK